MRNFKIVFTLSAFLLSNCQKNNSPVETPNTAPIKYASIITSNAINIFSDSALVKAEIILNGDLKIITETGICYSTLPNPDITKSVIINTLSNVTFNCYLTNLNPNTKYFVKAYFKNNNSIIYGNEISFTSSRFNTILGNKFFNSIIYSINTDLGGNVYAGYSNVARWNGVTWDDNFANFLYIANPVSPSGPVRTITRNQAGDIFAPIRKASVEYYMRKYDGNMWSDVGIYDLSNHHILNSCADLNGNIYATGIKTNINGKYFITSWGPLGYRELGSFDDYLTNICTDINGNLYASGSMNNGNGHSNFYIAKWNGTTWSQIGNFNDLTTDICTDANGNLYVAGHYSNANNNYYIAKWNGTTWSEVGNLNIPYGYYNSGIQHICIDLNGNIYAVGDIKNSNGKLYMAKWDGSSWSEYATFQNPVYSICTDNKGGVYAATSINGLWCVVKCN